MDETHVFKVLGGWRHSSDLILRPDRVQLNKEVLLADEIEWIRMRVQSFIHTGLKMGTDSILELGGAHKSLAFSLHDELYSTVRTSTFFEIWSVVHRFYGSRIIQGMLNILAAGGSLSIGKVRFRAEGVEVPEKRLLGLVSGDLQLVPWSRIRCQVFAGTVNITVSDDQTLQATKSFWKTHNACLVESLVHSVQGILSRQSGTWPEAEAAWRRSQETAEAARRHAEEERRKQGAAEEKRRKQEAAEEERWKRESAEAARQYAALKGYKLSVSEAAQAISVTRGTLQEYIKSGRLRMNPDGTIEAVELLRAGFIVRNLPPHVESSAASRGRGSGLT